MDNQPWIQNVSLEDVKKGYHYDAGPNSVLIQICDPDEPFPQPKYTFKHTHQFHFLDIEEDGLTNLGDGTWTDLSQYKITDHQAVEIARVLGSALASRSNVVVHCHMGVCRSGAVCEVGVMIGFRDTEGYRQPNLLVKKKLMQALGLSYS
jgi:predicted protein tyrosine phosphatase